MDPISFDLSRYNVHRATRTAILDSDLLLVEVGCVEKAAQRQLRGALLQGSRCCPRRYKGS